MPSDRCALCTSPLDEPTVTLASLGLSPGAMIDLLPFNTARRDHDYHAREPVYPLSELVCSTCVPLLSRLSAAAKDLEDAKAECVRRREDAVQRREAGEKFFSILLLILLAVVIPVYLAIMYNHYCLVRKYVK